MAAVMCGTEHVQLAARHVSADDEQDSDSEESDDEADQVVQVCALLMRGMSHTPKPSEAERTAGVQRAITTVNEVRRVVQYTAASPLSGHKRAR
jgi:hypothetical protein